MLDINRIYRGTAAKYDPAHSIMLPLPCQQMMEHIMAYAIESTKRKMRNSEKVDYKTNVQWMFIGKVAERIFEQWIRINGGIIGKTDLKSHKPDRGDFFTQFGESVDVKTASMSYHQNFNIPEDMCSSERLHDFFVGIRLQFTEAGSTIPDLYQLESAKLCGFALCTDVEALAPVDNTLCASREVPLSSLRDPRILLERFTVGVPARVVV